MRKLGPESGPSFQTNPGVARQPMQLATEVGPGVGIALRVVVRVRVAAWDPTGSPSVGCPPFPYPVSRPVFLGSGEAPVASAKHGPESRLKAQGFYLATDILKPSKWDILVRMISRRFENMVSSSGKQVHLVIKPVPKIA